MRGSAPWRLGLILTRTPFRASFFGGGTDIPWFYEEHGPGAVVSVAINKYVYLSIRDSFFKGQTLLKYSETESVSDVTQIRHPIFRRILASKHLSGIEIGVTSDIPAGTGLGSSSTFTVGLLRLLDDYRGNYRSSSEIAESAFEIEHELSEGAIGKQDQYASAIGGFNQFVFNADGTVNRTPIEISEKQQLQIDSSLFLVFTGVETRSATSVLQRQREEASKSQQKLESLFELRRMALEFPARFQAEGTDAIGNYLEKAWDLKVASTYSEAVNVAAGIIETGIKAGARGGKLLGAGGGGFVLFWVDPDNHANFAHRFEGELVIPISVDYEGTKVVFKD